MMKKPNDPLEYPPHYPPTDRWKKFFIGVRWLGPDLSFFKKLKLQQSSRTPECMSAWEIVEQRELANTIGLAFKKWLKWPTPYFLPADNFIVIANGPKFDMVDCGEFEEIIKEVEKYLDCKIPYDFLQLTKLKTFGEVVTEILSLCEAHNNRVNTD